MVPSVPLACFDTYLGAELDLNGNLEIPSGWIYIPPNLKTWFDFLCGLYGAI